VSETRTLPASRTIDADARPSFAFAFAGLCNTRVSTYSYYLKKHIFPWCIIVR